MRRPLSFVLVCASGLALGACRGQTSAEPPLAPIRNMFDQPRYDMQSQSAYFEDERTMRLPVDGTIPREQEIEPSIATGRDEGGAYVLTIPTEVVRAARIAPSHPGAESPTGMTALLERGHQRFDIYCSPCHSRVGDGQGIVVKRGMQPPPSFHIDRIRHMPDGQLFATLSDGLRAMPSYKAQIPLADRWAIVAWVRALEISQAQRAETP